MNQEQSYNSSLEIQQANKELGKNWFDRHTLRFFSTRISDIVYAGKYFITSEKFDKKTGRRYSIRKCVNGDIETISFMAYATLAEAKGAVKKL